MIEFVESMVTIGDASLILYEFHLGFDTNIVMLVDLDVLIIGKVDTLDEILVSESHFTFRYSYFSVEFKFNRHSVILLSLYYKTTPEPCK